MTRPPSRVAAREQPGARLAVVERCTGCRKQGPAGLTVLVTPAVASQRARGRIPPAVKVDAEIEQVATIDVRDGHLAHRLRRARGSNRSVVAFRNVAVEILTYRPRIVPGLD